MHGRSAAPSRALLESLESRRLLSGAPALTPAQLLASTYQGTVQLHVTHGHHGVRTALSIYFDPSLNSAGLLTGTLNLPNEPALNFAAALKRHSLQGSWIGSSGVLAGQFSLHGNKLDGTFWDAVDGQRLIGHFHTTNPALAPHKAGTPGGKAAASASSNSPSSVPLSVGFSQTAIGSTTGAANTNSTTTGTDTSTGTGVSTTGAAGSNIAGNANANGSNTISLPALGLTIGNLDGNSDLASGVNGSSRTQAGPTTAQQNANAFVSNGAANASVPSAAGESATAGTGGPANSTGGVNASTVQGASGVSGIFTTVDTFTGLPAVTVAPMTFVTD